MVEQKPQDKIENNTTTQERQMNNINFLHVHKETMKRQVYSNEIPRRLLQYRQCSMGCVTNHHRRREKLSFNSRLWANSSMDLRRRKFGMVKCQLFKGRTYQPHVWIRNGAYRDGTSNPVSDRSYPSRRQKSLFSPTLFLGVGSQNLYKYD